MLRRLCRLARQPESRTNRVCVLIKTKGNILLWNILDPVIAKKLHSGVVLI
jgi:hypothetical protein